MRNLLLLAFIGCLLTGCLRDIVFGGGEKSAAPSKPPSKTVIDPYTHEEVKMWMPKNGTIRNAVWAWEARGEERLCSDGDYKGKQDTSLLPSKRGVYKKLSSGGWVWAYYYYYGEEIPGFDTTDWYITVFNIYVKPDGTIYGCAWRKYPFSYRLKYGTNDGINPHVHPPR